MAVPSDVTLVNLNQPYVFKGWFPGSYGIVDQFIRKVPFLQLQQPTTQVNWNLLSTSNVVVPYPPNPSSPLPTTPLNFTQSSVTLTRIGDSVLVDNYSEAASGNVNDLLQVEIQAKRVAIIQQLGLQITQGNGTSPNLSGFSTLVTSNQEFTQYSPTPLHIYQLINLVRASDGSVGSGADCLVMDERVLRYLLTILPSYADYLDFVYDQDLGVPIPHFKGIPMYIGQVPAYGSPLVYDIWALKMTGPTGIRVLHATGTSDQYGIDVIQVPMQYGQAQVGAFVGGLYGLMVPEAHSIARITGVADSMLTSNGIVTLPP
jgi:hypothetical protein